MVMIVAAVTVIVVLALPGYLWAMVRVPQNARRQLASDMSWGIVVGLVNWILTMSWGDSSQYSPIQVAISGADGRVGSVVHMAVGVDTHAWCSSDVGCDRWLRRRLVRNGNAFRCDRPMGCWLSVLDLWNDRRAEPSGSYCCRAEVTRCACAPVAYRRAALVAAAPAAIPHESH